MIPKSTHFKEGLGAQALSYIYHMPRACKYITRTVIGHYLGPDFPVMPTENMSDDARLVKGRKRRGV